MKKRLPLLMMALICLFAISLTAITVSRYTAEETAPPFDLSIKPREYEPISITYHNTEAYTLHEDGTLQIKDYFCVEDPDTAPLMKWYETVAIADAGFTNQKVDGVDRYPNAGSVKALVIPGTVKVIGATAFMTYNLESIQLAEGVESISVSAFANLGTLTDFYLPKSLISFSGIQNPFTIQSYTVHSENPKFYAKDGVLFSKTNNVLIQFPPKWGTAHSTSVYTVPEEAKSIQGNAFNNHDIVAIVTNLKSASGTTGNWGSNKLIAIDNQLGAEITGATQANGVYTLTATLPDSYTDPHVAITNMAAATYSAPVVNNTITVYPDWYGDTCRITLGTNMHYGYAIMDADGNLKLYNQPEAPSVQGTLYSLPGFITPAGASVASSITEMDKTTVKTVEAVDALIPGTMAGWFSGMTECLRMDLTKLDTRSCTDMTSLFQNCAKLNSIFVGSKWDVGRVASSSNMFAGCAAAAYSHMGVYEFALMGGSGTYFDGNTTDKTLAVIDGKNGASGLLTDGENPRGYAVYCQEDVMVFLKDSQKPIPGDKVTVPKEHIIDADGNIAAEDRIFTVSEVFEGIENIAYHFTDLQTYDFLIPEWALEVFSSALSTGTPSGRVMRVTNAYMVGALSPRSTVAWFTAFANVKYLLLQNLDLRNVTNMSLMFEMTASMQYISMPTAINPSIASIANLFNQNTFQMMSTPSQLLAIDGIDDWDVSGIQNFESIFQGCSALFNLDLSQWRINTPVNGGLVAMFKGCSGLTSLQLFNLTISGSTNREEQMQEMFSGCSGLEKLNLTSFNFHRNTNFTINATDMFAGMTSLHTITLPASFVPSSDSGVVLPPYDTTTKAWYDDAGTLYTAQEAAAAERVSSTQYRYQPIPTLVCAIADTELSNLKFGNGKLTVTLAADTLPTTVTATLNGNAITVTYDAATGTLSIPADSFALGDTITISAITTKYDPISDYIAENLADGSLHIESGTYSFTEDDLNPDPNQPMALTIVGLDSNVRLEGDILNISNANVMIVGATFENIPTFTGSNTTIQLIDCTFENIGDSLNFQVGQGVELSLKTDTGMVIAADSLNVSAEGAFSLNGYEIESTSVALTGSCTIQHSRFTNSVSITAADAINMTGVRFTGAELVVEDNTSLTLDGTDLAVGTLRLGSNASVYMANSAMQDPFARIVGGENASVTIAGSAVECSSDLSLEGTIALTIHNTDTSTIGLIANSGSVITINTGEYVRFIVADGATLDVSMIADGPMPPSIYMVTIQEGGTLIVGEGLKQADNGDGTYAVIQDTPILTILPTTESYGVSKNGTTLTFQQVNGTEFIYESDEYYTFQVQETSGIGGNISMIYVELLDESGIQIGTLYISALWNGNASGYNLTGETISMNILLSDLISLIDGRTEISIRIMSCDYMSMAAPD